MVHTEYKILFAHTEPANHAGITVIHITYLTVDNGKLRVTEYRKEKEKGPFRKGKFNGEREI